MFDFHMHSKLSFDSCEEPIEMVKAACKKGLKEIFALPTTTIITATETDNTIYFQ